MNRNQIEHAKISLFIFVISMALAFSVGCTQKGDSGRPGLNGAPGVGCEVLQLSNGAEIKCGGTTTAVILNGQDGQDLSPGAYTVIEIIDPCGKQAAFDEVILRLSNGQLLAHYSEGNKEFLTLITAGNYETTDGTRCRFSVDHNLTLSDASGNYWTVR